MGILKTVYGHDRVQGVLIQAFLRGALPSQLLFVGPEGVGKKRVAWGMSELLLCARTNLHPNNLNSTATTATTTAPAAAAASIRTTPSITTAFTAPANTDATPDATITDTAQACGRCSSCVKIQSGFHESVLLIEPEKNLIKLEKSKEIQDFLSLSHDDKARIVIVDDAHALNPQAANSLLKLIEEPPPKTYFFFITHRWAQLLPTIRSRTTKISFKPLSDHDLSHWADPTKEAELIRLARGSVKELLNQKQEEATFIRTEAYELFHQFFSQPSYVILGSWRDVVKDKDKLMLFIRYWLISLHEYLSQKSLQPDLKNGETLAPHLRGLLIYRDEVVWSLWERGLTLEAGILGHRDPVLLLEEWLLTNDMIQRKGINNELMD